MGVGRLVKDVAVFLREATKGHVEDMYSIFMYFLKHSNLCH